MQIAPLSKTIIKKQKPNVNDNNNKSEIHNTTIHYTKDNLKCSSADTAGYREYVFLGFARRNLDLQITLNSLGDRSTA